MDAQWEQMTRNQTRFSILKQRELERKKKYSNINLIESLVEIIKNIFRTLMQQLQEENTHIADEQKAHTNYMENVVFTNQPTIEYFSQFNTSTR